MLAVPANGVLANDARADARITAGYDANYVVAGDATANELWEDTVRSGVD